MSRPIALGLPRVSALGSGGFSRSDFNRLVSAYYLDSSKSDGPFFAATSDYDFLFESKFATANQVLNRGLAITENATVYRNAVEFDGLTSYVDTGYVPAADEYMECRIIPTVTATLKGVFGAATDSVTRFGVFLQNGNWTLGYKNAIDESAVAATTDETVLGICGAGELFVNGVKAVSTTATTGALPSISASLGSYHSIGAYSSRYDCEFLRVRVFDYTVGGIENCTGDPEADALAGLCVLKPDWRMRTQDVDASVGAEKIIDDNGGTYTIDNAVTAGAISVAAGGLTATVASTYDCNLENGSLSSASSVIENPVGTAVDPLTDGVSCTLFLDFQIPTGSAELQFLFGWSIDASAKFTGLALWTSNILRAYISNGTASQYLTFGAVGTARLKVAIVYDIPSLKMYVYKNGVIVNAGGTAITTGGTVPTFANGGRLATCHLSAAESQTKSAEVDTYETQIIQRALTSAEAIALTGGA